MQQNHFVNRLLQLTKEDCCKLITSDLQVIYFYTVLRFLHIPWLCLKYIFLTKSSSFSIGIFIRPLTMISAFHCILWSQKYPCWLEPTFHSGRYSSIYSKVTCPLEAFQNPQNLHNSLKFFWSSEILYMNYGEICMARLWLFVIHLFQSLYHFQVLLMHSLSKPMNLPAFLRDHATILEDIFF